MEEEVQVTQIDPGTGLPAATGRDRAMGAGFGQRTTGDISEHDYQMRTTTDPQQRQMERYNSQGAWEGVKRGTARFAGNAALGVVKGITDIPDILINLAMLKAGEPERMVTNPISEQLGSMMEDLSASMPIYTNPYDKFNPGSSNWWMSHSDSLASAAGYIIPSKAIAGGVVKILGGITKAAKVGKGLRNAQAAGSLTAALYTTSHEALGSIQQTYPQIYQGALKAFNGDEDKARKFASEQASQMFRTNMWNVVPEAIGISKLLKTPASSRNLLKGYLGRSKNIVLSESIPEAFQEAVNVLSEKQAIRNTDILRGKESYGYTVIGDLIYDEDAWTSMVMGAAGGSVFQRGGKAMQGASEVEGLAKVPEALKSFFTANTSLEANLLAEQKVITDSYNETMISFGQIQEMAGTIGDTELQAKVDGILTTNEAFKNFEKGTTEVFEKTMDTIIEAAEFAGDTELAEKATKKREEVLAAEKIFNNVKATYPTLDVNNRKEYVIEEGEINRMQEAVKTFEKEYQEVVSRDEHGIYNLTEKDQEKIEELKSIEEQISQYEKITSSGSPILDSTKDKNISKRAFAQSALKNLYEQKTKIEKALRKKPSASMTLEIAKMNIAIDEKRKNQKNLLSPKKKDEFSPLEAKVKNKFEETIAANRLRPLVTAAGNENLSQVIDDEEFNIIEFSKNRDFNLDEKNKTALENKVDESIGEIKQKQKEHRDTLAALLVANDDNTPTDDSADELIAVLEENPELSGAFGAYAEKAFNAYKEGFDAMNDQAEELESLKTDLNREIEYPSYETPIEVFNEIVDTFLSTLSDVSSITERKLFDSLKTLETFEEFDKTYELENKNIAVIREQLNKGFKALKEINKRQEASQRKARKNYLNSFGVNSEEKIKPTPTDLTDLQERLLSLLEELGTDISTLGNLINSDIISLLYVFAKNRLDIKSTEQFQNFKVSLDPTDLEGVLDEDIIKIIIAIRDGQRNNILSGSTQSMQNILEAEAALDIKEKPFHQQLIAIRELVAMFFNSNVNYTYLQGVAGSGKSKIVTKYVVELIRLLGKNPGIRAVAPGEHANSVITKSLFGASEQVDHFESSESIDALILDLVNKKIKYLVVDEVGKLDLQRLNYFHDKINGTGIKILFTGDPNQRTVGSEFALLGEGSNFRDEIHNTQALDISQRTGNYDILTAQKAFLESGGNKVKKLQTTSNTDSTEGVENLSLFAFGKMVKERLNLSDGKSRLLIIDDSMDKEIVAKQMGLDSIKDIRTLSESQGSEADEVFIKMNYTGRKNSIQDTSFNGHYYSSNVDMYVALSRAVNYVAMHIGEEIEIESVKIDLEKSEEGGAKLKEKFKKRAKQYEAELAKMTGKKVTDEFEKAREESEITIPVPEIVLGEEVPDGVLSAEEETIPPTDTEESFPTEESNQSLFDIESKALENERKKELEEVAHLVDKIDKKKFEDKINAVYDKKLDELRDKYGVNEKSLEKKITQSNEPLIETIGNVTVGTSSKLNSEGNPVEDNEDAVYIDTENGVYSVSDGMGTESFVTVPAKESSKLTIEHLLTGKILNNPFKKVLDLLKKAKDLNEFIEIVKKEMGVSSLASFASNRLSLFWKLAKANGDLTNTKGLRIGATGLIARKVSANTYEIKKVGDTVYFVVGIDGKVNQQHGMTSESTTSGYMYSVKEGEPHVETSELDTFTVTLKEGETLVLATDFIETENAMQDFIDSDFGKNLDFVEFQKNNKVDDSTFISVKYDSKDTNNVKSTNETSPVIDSVKIFPVARQIGHVKAGDELFVILGSEVDPNDPSKTLVREVFLRKEGDKMYQVGVGEVLPNGTASITTRREYSENDVRNLIERTVKVTKASKLKFKFNKAYEAFSGKSSGLLAKVKQLFTSNNIEPSIKSKVILITTKNSEQIANRINNSSMFIDADKAVKLGRTYIEYTIKTDTGEDRFFYVPTRAKKYSKESNDYAMLAKLINDLKILNKVFAESKITYLEGQTPVEASLAEFAEFGNSEKVTVTTANGVKVEVSKHNLAIRILKGKQSQINEISEYVPTDTIFLDVAQQLFEVVTNNKMENSSVDLLSVNNLGLLTEENSTSREVEEEPSNDPKYPKWAIINKKGTSKSGPSKVFRTVFVINHDNGTFDLFVVDKKEGAKVSIRRYANQKDGTSVDRREMNAKGEFKQYSSNIPEGLNPHEVSSYLLNELSDETIYRNGPTQKSLNNISKSNSTPFRRQGEYYDGGIDGMRYGTTVQTLHSGEAVITENDGSKSNFNYIEALELMLENFENHFQNISLHDVKNDQDKVIDQLETSLDDVTPTVLEVSDKTNKEPGEEAEEPTLPGSGLLTMGSKNTNREVEKVEEQLPDSDGFESVDDSLDEDLDFFSNIESQSVKFDLGLKGIMSYINRQFPFLSDDQIKFIPLAILQRKHGKNVYGVYKNGVFYLGTQDGKVSTIVLRHETFHLFFNRFLTPDQRSTMVNVTGRSIKYKEWIEKNHLIDNTKNREEYLAYSYQNKNWNYNKFSNPVMQFMHNMFLKLKDYVQSAFDFFMLEESDKIINDLFRDINSGKFDRVTNNISNERFMKDLTTSFKATTLETALNAYTKSVEAIKEYFYKEMEGGDKKHINKFTISVKPNKDGSFRIEDGKLNFGTAYGKLIRKLDSMFKKHPNGNAIAGLLRTATLEEAFTLYKQDPGTITEGQFYLFALRMNKTTLDNLTSAVFGRGNIKTAEKVAKDFVSLTQAKGDAADVISANLSQEIMENNQHNNEDSLTIQLKQFFALVPRSNPTKDQDKFINPRKVYVKVLSFLAEVDNLGDVGSTQELFTKLKEKFVAGGISLADDLDILKRLEEIWTFSNLHASRRGGILLRNSFDPKYVKSYNSTLYVGGKEYRIDPENSNYNNVLSLIVKDVINSQELIAYFNSLGLMNVEDMSDFLNEIYLQGYYTDLIANINYEMRQAKTNPHLASEASTHEWQIDENNDNKKVKVDERIRLTGLSVDSIATTITNRFMNTIINFATKSPELFHKILREKLASSLEKRVLPASYTRQLLGLHKKVAIPPRVNAIIFELLSRNVNKLTSTESIRAVFADSSSYLDEVAELLAGQESFLTAQNYLDGKNNRRYIWVVRSFVYDVVNNMKNGKKAFSFNSKRKGANKIFTNKNIFLTGVNKVLNYIEFDTYKIKKSILKGKVLKNLSDSHYYALKFVASFLETSNNTDNEYYQFGIRESNRNQDGGIKVKVLNVQGLRDGIAAGSSMEDTILEIKAEIKSEKFSKERALHIEKINNKEVPISEEDGYYFDKYGMTFSQFYKAYDVKNIHKTRNRSFETGESLENFVERKRTLIEEDFKEFIDSWKNAGKNSAYLMGPVNKFLERNEDLQSTLGMNYAEDIPTDLDLLRDAYTIWWMQNYVNGFHFDNMIFGSHHFTKNSEDHIKREQGIRSPGKPILTGPNHAPQVSKMAVFKDTERTKNSFNDLQKLYSRIHGMPYEITDAGSFLLPTALDELKAGTGDYSLGEVIKNIVFYIDPNSGVPVYIKTASFILTEELQESFPELKDIADNMKELGVQHYIPESAFKLGSPNDVVQNGEKIKNHHIRDLHYKGYKIQSNPVHAHESEKQSNFSQFNYFLNVNYKNFEKAKTVYEADATLATLQFQLFNLESKVLDEDGTVNKPNLIERILKSLGDSDNDNRIVDLVKLGNLSHNFPSLVSKFIIQTANIFSKNSSEVNHIGNKLVVQPSLGVILFNTDKGPVVYSELDEESKLKADKFHGLSYNLKEFLKEYSLDTLNEHMNHIKNGSEYSRLSEADQLELNSILNNSESYLLPRKLKMRTEDNYTEVIMPKWWLDEQGLSDGEYIYHDTKSKTGIAVRIPTTGIHSAIAIRVIASPTKTNLIIVPEEIVPLHGSDFDVDSLFYIRRETVSKKDRIIIDETSFEKIVAARAVMKSDIPKSEKRVIANKMKELKNSFPYGLVGYTKEGEWDSVMYDKIQKELSRKDISVEFRMNLLGIAIKLEKNLKIDAYLEIITAPKNAEDMNTPIEFTAIKADIFSELEAGSTDIISALQSAELPTLIREEVEAILKDENGNWVDPSLWLDLKALNDKKNPKLIISDEVIKSKLLATQLGVVSKLKIISNKLSLKSSRDVFRAGDNLKYHKDNFGGVSGTGIQANLMKAIAYLQYAAKMSKIDPVVKQKDEVVPGEEQTYSPIEVIFDGVNYNTLEVLTKVDGLRTTELGDTVLNGYIDNVKEQITSIINANGHTLSVIGTMIALGMDIDLVTYFMNQPVIKHITSNPSGLDRLYKEVKKDFGKTAKNIEKQDAKDKLNEFSEGVDIGAINESLANVKTKEEGISKETLISNIRLDDSWGSIVKSDEFIIEQMKVVEMFMKLKQIAASVESNASYLSILKDLPVEYHKMVESLQKNTSKSLVADLTQVPNVSASDNSLRRLIHVIQEMFAVYSKEYDQFFISLYNNHSFKLSQERGEDIATPLEKVEYIRKAFQNYIMSGLTKLNNEGYLGFDVLGALTKTSSEVEVFLSPREAAIQAINQKIVNFKGDNLFMAFISVKPDGNGNNRISFTAGTNIDSEFKLKLTNAYMQLPKDLKQDLLKYSAVVDGASFGFKSYTNLIPPTESSIGAEDGLDFLSNKYEELLQNIDLRDKDIFEMQFSSVERDLVKKPKHYQKVTDGDYYVFKGGKELLKEELPNYFSTFDNTYKLNADGRYYAIGKVSSEAYDFGSVPDTAKSVVLDRVAVKKLFSEGAVIIPGKKSESWTGTVKILNKDNNSVGYTAESHVTPEGLVITNPSRVSYSKKSKSNKPMNRVKLDKTLELLSKNTGSEYVTDPSEFKKALKDAGHVGPYPAGFVYKGKVYINTTGEGNMYGEDTALHEFAHLYINSLKSKNPTLYERILVLAKKSGYYDSVKALYPELSERDLLEEVAATYIGAEGKIESGITYSIKRFLRSIGIEIFTTLNDLATDLLTTNVELVNVELENAINKVEALKQKMLESGDIKIEYNELCK